ncbi:hypothetical protein [Latilactobacillus curvatus]|uniref:hypothetical protein n=1 Tax=Latilactobacillus curvatus TaxID=28038 RepID=UPI000AA585CD|nr:hypothetical protein [Latilactobacillus curvatus]
MKKTTNRWIALVAMSLGVFMGLLDVTVVNVALPSMAIDFKVDCKINPNAVRTKKISFL